MIILRSSAFAGITTSKLWGLIKKRQHAARRPPTRTRARAHARPPRGAREEADVSVGCPYFPWGPVGCWCCLLLLMIIMNTEYASCKFCTGDNYNTHHTHSSGTREVPADSTPQHSPRAAAGVGGNTRTSCLPWESWNVECSQQHSSICSRQQQ
jgi:hypothetical protein